MTSKKKPASTEKTRQSAIKAIGSRIERIDSGDVAPSGGQGTTTVAAAGSPVPPKGGKKAAKPAKAPKVDKPKKEGPSKLSGLDAAAKILKDTGKSMNCKELVAAAFRLNLWKSEGATPDATLSAAIGREMRAKGGDARFRKTERGKFAATKN